MTITVKHMPRSAAIYHAKAAYVLWITRAIWAEDFHPAPAGNGYVAVFEHWMVFLKLNGELLRTVRL